MGWYNVANFGFGLPKFLQDTVLWMLKFFVYLQSSLLKKSVIQNHSCLHFFSNLPFPINFSPIPEVAFDLTVTNCHFAHYLCFISPSLCSPLYIIFFPTSLVLSLNVPVLPLLAKLYCLSQYTCINAISWYMVLELSVIDLTLPILLKREIFSIQML